MASKRLSFIVLAACAALAFAAVGCGDDDGGKGGGKDAGSDAGGGKDAGGGNVQACIDDTVALKVDEACATCACEKKTAEAQACADDAQCWALISCIGQYCPTDSTCIATTCKDYAAGLPKAQAIGMTLRGECASSCVAPATDAGPGADAGDDAGADAGH